MSLGVVFAPVLILLSSGVVWADRLADQNLPRVCIEDGCMIGTWKKSVRSEWFEAFIGIPFAKPPIGALRFANPVPNDRWVEKELDATGRFQKPPCIQVDLFANGQGVQGNEDCLYLNVYRPIAARKNKFPTVVYIYGGGYYAGTNSPLILGPEKLMVQPVILVTIAYRVGLLGFFSTGDEAASGNFGLKDQRLALRWVHRNIRAFGGDPRLVTIMGQSAGGASVQLQMMHLGNAGLFQRAISLSGSALAPWSTPQGNLERVARLQATIAGIKDAMTMSTSKLVKALRAIDAKRLAGSIGGFTNGSLFPVFVYGPTVEKATVKDAFLTATPQELWSQGAYLPVPWLTGILPNDGFALSAPFINLTTRVAETSIQLDTLLLYIMRGAANPNALPLLKERFFSDASSFGGYLTAENIDSLTMLFNEGAFYYPLALSVKQQFQHKNGSSTTGPPTYVYQFNYKGQFSYSVDFATANNASRDFEIVHSDDTIYIFSTPARFPNFQPGSPDAQASQRFTKFLVDFARTGVVKTKPSESGINAAKRDGFPLAIEFYNKENQQDPLGLRLNRIYDRDILNFWTSIYSSSM